MKKQSFILGASLLAISGVLCKILGAVYKVPLANLLGTEGMGIYYLVFPIYSFLLTLSSASLPTVISRMVSETMAEGKTIQARKIFKASMILALFLGFIFTILMCVFSGIFSDLEGIEGGAIAFISIAPALLFVAGISALRGYFQGLQNMTPTSVSQIIEQIGKIMVGFAFSTILLKFGIIYAVVGSLLGVVVSELIGLIYLLICYCVYIRKHTKKEVSFDHNNEDVDGYFELMGRIFRNSLPFLFGSILFPLSSVVDNFLIINILKKSGYEFSLASSLLGINTGVVSTLTNLPVTIAIALAMAIIPTISSALARNEDDVISQKIEFAIKIILIITIPCISVFIAFPDYVVSVLFSGAIGSGSEFVVACNLLMISAINVFYLSFLQIFTAVLQACKKAYIPVWSLFFAIVIKTGVEYFLLTLRQVNILGVVISNSVCYFIAVLIDLIYLRRIISLKLNFSKLVVFPAVSSGIMLGVIYVSIKVLYSFISARWAILLSFAFGVLAYFLFLFLFKVFSKQELSFAIRNRKQNVE